MQLAKSSPVLVQQRRLFLSQFEKDLDFFKLFFLLVNKSCLIKHMGVLWALDGPAAEIGLSELVGTEAAMQTPCSRYLRCDPNLNPDFCGIVSDHGRHEAESCGMSDRAAERRCRETGQSQVYTCHAGLVDIAVPVIHEGQYLATLLCGQVLRDSPTEAGFQQVRKNVEGLVYINLERLEAAYWRVPVSSEGDIENVVRILETFAKYLATSWARLFELVTEQQQTIRESQLLRKEFAHVLLAGNPSDRSVLQDLMDRLGFTLTPNRVLVVQLEPEDQCSAEVASFDVGFTAALHGIEEFCDTQENMAVAYLRKRGISIFFHDHGSRGLDSTSCHPQLLAHQILDAIRGHSSLRVRIGIGGVQDDLRSLVESYDEACMALAQSHDVVAAYRKPVEPIEELSAAAERVCACLSARKLAEAKLAIDSLRLLANQRLGDGPASLGRQRQFFCSTLYAMCFCAKQLGADRDVLDQVLWTVDTEMHGAAVRLQLHEYYQRFADQILEEIRKLYSSRHDKLVERACRDIDQRIRSSAANHRISSSQVAAILEVSASHLGRKFKQATGVTFERFVMQRRVDYAKQLLLDPAYNVSQAAEKCGCTDAAYFARVFRQIAGCTPREYMQDPLRFGKRETNLPIEFSDAAAHVTGLRQLGAAAS